MPPTVAGILELLSEQKISLEGKHVVFVGRGTLVGKPGGVVFGNLGASVSTIDENTEAEIYYGQLKNADIIVSGVGKPNLITADRVGEGQVLIDAGYGKNSQGETTGDMDFESVSKKASYITPVPGGIGPLTVSKLFENLLYVAKQKRR